MELTIALFFFAIAAAVCLQLFVKSHNINSRCSAANDAHSIATSIADRYLAGSLEDVLAKADTLYYSAELEESLDEMGGVAYVASLNIDDGLLCIDVKSADEKYGYSLSVYKYIPKEVVR